MDPPYSDQQDGVIVKPKHRRLDDQAQSEGYGSMSIKSDSAYSSRPPPGPYDSPRSTSDEDEGWENRAGHGGAQGSPGGEENEFGVPDQRRSDVDR